MRWLTLCGHDRGLHGHCCEQHFPKIKVYTGYEGLPYSTFIGDLTPGIEYFVRVTAITEPSTDYSLYSPSAYVGYPLTPESLAPMAVPDTITNMQQHVRDSFGSTRAQQHLLPTLPARSALTTCLQSTTNPKAIMVRQWSITSWSFQRRYKRFKCSP